MKLRVARQLFFQLRTEDQIDICEEHVIGDHPEREYCDEEVLSLVNSRGTFHDTTDSRFLGKRFYWRTQDIEGRKVRLVLDFPLIDGNQVIRVISAGERT